MDKNRFVVCEIKDNYKRVCRHISFLEKSSKATHYGDEPVLGVEDDRACIVKAIELGNPFMAARFGTSEGNALYEYWRKQLFQRHEYSKRCFQEMGNNAGFFPVSEENLDRWAMLETEACSDLDMLGTMNFKGEEWIYRTFCNNAKLMPAGGIASAAKGWTWVLEGKKVLVVHPFTETIKSQYYNHRTEIFPGSNALPEFDLKTVQAVQTIAGTKDERFNDWFEALDYMTEEASKQDFDVALIGCGAYGFQLASRVKRMGKIAIHMGGALQTLFGIKGSRWDVQYSAMYNDAWVYPSVAETPIGCEKVEGGCYWEQK